MAPAFIIASALLAAGAAPDLAAAEPVVTEVAASPPTALAVTIYRAPQRNGGPLDLQRLAGFALITETRTVTLPQGVSRLRFEDVADGIQAQSAILTGLPDGVIEKDRDDAVLSPEALVRAALGADVTLVRVNTRTGASIRTPATIRSATVDGVIFQTAEGAEAFRCSGLGEAIRLTRTPRGLRSAPTLSVLTRAARPLTARVTLSYLAAGFDWAASYTAQIAPDGRTFDLGAWITLANANGLSLRSASTQIVAGRLNRVAPRGAPPPPPPVVLARCWPRGSTSDRPAAAAPIPEAPSPKEILVTAQRRLEIAQDFSPPPPPTLEDLGDLKLYRLAEPTTVAGHEMKQVRLLDAPRVAFTTVYTADLVPGAGDATGPARMSLRTRNARANGLGAPLPAGSVVVSRPMGARELLVGEAPVKDTALDEDVELALGASGDVMVKRTTLSAGAAGPAPLGLAPGSGLARAAARGEVVEEVALISALPTSAPFELRLQPHGARITATDGALGAKDGRPIFRLLIPPRGVVTLRYAFRR